MAAKGRRKSKGPRIRVRRTFPGFAQVTASGPGRRPQTFWIPVDGRGNIPRDVAIARLMEVDSGDRKGRKRSVLLDIAVDAATVAPARPRTDRDRLLQYAWWIHPNESDIAGIDTSDADWGLAGGARGKRAAIAIVGATKAEQAAVVEIINRNFTDHERRQMKGLVIEVSGSAGPGVAGYYQWSPDGPAFDRIVIGRSYLMHEPDPAGPNRGSRIDDVTVTHELVHMLRQRDQRRRGHVSGMGRHDRESDFDSDIEEVFTDAETVSRSRTAPDRARASYYQFVPGAGTRPGIRHTARIHDKQLLMNVRRGSGPKVAPGAMAREIASERTGRAADASGFRDAGSRDRLVRRMFAGKKGLNAVRAVDARFPHLEIARAEIHGRRSEAIDTFYRLRARLGGRNATVYTHIRSPRGAASAATRKKIAGPIAGRLVEFRDGRAVRVRGEKGRAAATPGKAPTQRQLDRAAAAAFR